MVKADSATAVTAPTADVSAVPTIVSTVVWTDRPPTVALLAAKVNPEHVTATLPALTAVFTVITTASELNAAEDAALGLGTNSQNVDPLTTDETSPPGKATVILSPTGRLVEVVNEIEAVWDAPTVRERVAETEETAPTAGVLMYAAIVSVSVSIFTPVVPEGVESTAVFAAKVNPEQVIVIEPAGTIDLTVIVIALAAKAVAEATAGLGTSSQLVAVATAVSNEAGNVKVIFLSTASSVDALKVKAAV